MAASRLHSQKDKNQAVELSMVLTNREGEPVELSIVLKDEGVDLTHRVPCTGKTDQWSAQYSWNSFLQLLQLQRLCNQMEGTFFMKKSTIRKTCLVEALTSVSNSNMPILLHEQMEQVYPFSFGHKITFPLLCFKDEGPQYKVLWFWATSFHSEVNVKVRHGSEQDLSFVC